MVEKAYLTIGILTPPLKMIKLKVWLRLEFRYSTTRVKKNGENSKAYIFRA